MSAKANRRTVVTLLLGITIGIIFSPISLIWIHVQQSTEFIPVDQLNPLCVATLHTAVTDSSKTRIEKNATTQEFMPPPPQYPHNNTVLSLRELTNEVPPPNDPAVRFKEITNELAPRKLLFVGVVTAQKYLDTRALGIYRTWGKDIPDLYFFSSHPNKSTNLPIITLPGINDTQYPPQRKVYHMLKYMHDHFIDQFDFFMRADDDVYVKADMLLSLLGNTNPAQDIYMGCPGFGRPDDRDRIKLDENEHYCMGGPGVIFSRSSLRKLAPHLDECLKTVVVSYNEDVEVGRCVSKMLKLQCTWSWETSILFWTDYKKVLQSPELYTNEDVKKAITLHPLKQPELMYRVHQYLLELRLKNLLQNGILLQSSIEDVTQYLPEEASHFHNKQWLWYDVSVNPKSRYEIPMWEYFNSTRLFLTYEHMPVIGLPGSVKSGINTALEVLLDVMNGKEEHNHPFVPPYHLFDGFMVTDHSSGILYILHMSVHREAIEESIEYVANVFLPFQGVGMANYQDFKVLSSRVVNVIVSVAKTHDISEFLEMYESVCLVHKWKTHLHIALFGKNENTKSKVALLTKKYPKERITLHEVGNKGFSHSAGYDFVANTLNGTELMVFFDQNFIFTSEFLSHCRMNTIQGKRAYFPVLFSMYKPELVQKYIQRPPQMIISADSGFFLRYNYQVASIYKSDYTQIGGWGNLEQGASLNDDVRFLDRVLASDISVMRALEPYVRRNYKARSCKGLTGNTLQACMNSRVDAIGSKKILGSLIVNHDLLDKI